MTSLASIVSENMAQPKRRYICNVGDVIDKIFTDKYSDDEDIMSENESDICEETSLSSGDEYASDEEVSQCLSDTGSRPIISPCTISKVSGRATDQLHLQDHTDFQEKKEICTGTTANETRGTGGTTGYLR